MQGQGLMKTCPECTPPDSNVCDFCNQYAFNPDSAGYYIDMGFCKVHLAHRDPDSEVCDKFECRVHLPDKKEE